MGFEPQTSVGSRRRAKAVAAMAQSFVSGSMSRSTIWATTDHSEGTTITFILSLTQVTSLIDCIVKKLQLVAVYRLKSLQLLLVHVLCHSAVIFVEVTADEIFVIV